MKGNFLSGSGKYVSGFLLIIAFFLFMTLFSAKNLTAREPAGDVPVDSAPQF